IINPDFIFSAYCRSNIASLVFMIPFLIPSHSRANGNPGAVPAAAANETTKLDSCFCRNDNMEIGFKFYCPTALLRGSLLSRGIIRKESKNQPCDSFSEGLGRRLRAYQR